jgi:DNA polymerase III epsilon subunit-like protein
MWFISVDSETTGLNPDIHEVLELKATALARDLQYLGFFYAKIKMKNPEKASTEALKINGYSEEAWKDAQEPEVVYKNFQNWIEKMKKNVTYLAEYKNHDPIPLGQNPGFDVDMITKNANRYNASIKFSYHRFDLVTVSMLMDILKNKDWQKSYSLGNVAKAYGIEVSNAHTATGDEVMQMCLLQLYIQKLRGAFETPPLRKSFKQQLLAWIKKLIPFQK